MPLGVAGTAEALPGLPLPTGTAIDEPTSPTPPVDGSAWQIRIEQRVIIRIPRDPAGGPRSIRDLSAPRPLPPPDQQWRERRMGKCVATADLVGVRIQQPASLDLMMRDGTGVRAYLEDGCEAREFYSGFYMERNEDGRFCIRRDQLHSRTGMRCRVDRLRRLLPQR